VKKIQKAKYRTKVRIPPAMKNNQKTAFIGSFMTAAQALLVC
jgi:hypothetical protein